MIAGSLTGAFHTSVNPFTAVHVCTLYDGNKMQKLKCSFFIISMWTYLHKNAQYSKQVVVGFFCLFFLVGFFFFFAFLI